MSYPFYDLYSYEQNKDELPSKTLVYEFEYATKKGRMGVIISLSQPGFMRSKVW